MKKNDLAELLKPKYSKVMGIDNSTKSMAFAIFDDKGPIQWGEIYFRGANTYERIADARKKMSALCEHFDVGIIGIEKTMRVNSQQTAIYLAYSAGVVMSFLTDKAKVVEVGALQWQSKTSKPQLSRAEKAELKKQYSDKSVSWLRNKARLESKQRTKDWIKEKFGLDIASDNVSDAIALGYYLVGEYL